MPTSELRASVATDALPIEYTEQFTTTLSYATRTTGNNQMTLKKGDRVQTEDGDVGEILFVDKGGLEAQVALPRISLKVRTDTLVKLAAEERPVAVAAPKAASRAPKRVRARRSTQG